MQSKPLRCRSPYPARWRKLRLSRHRRARRNSEPTDSVASRVVRGLSSQFPDRNQPPKTVPRIRTRRFLRGARGIGRQVDLARSLRRRLLPRTPKPSQSAEMLAAGISLAASPLEKAIRIGPSRFGTDRQRPNRFHAQIHHWIHSRPGIGGPVSGELRHGRREKKPLDLETRLSSIRNLAGRRTHRQLRANAPWNRSNRHSPLVYAASDRAG